MKKFLVLAGLVLAASLANGEDCPVLCGKQGGGLECPDNKCCSQDGKCGYGNDYCGGECQSGPCHPRYGVEQRCGKKFGDRRCSNNYCCGADGYCGFGMAYCNPGEYPTAEIPWVVRRYAGCQSGPCRNTPCSETNKCSNNQCCGPRGICGIGHLYCGDGCKGGPCYHRRGGIVVAGNATTAPQNGLPPKTQALTGPPTPPSKCQSRCGSANGGLLCPDNQCCSKDGKCGLGAEYCDLGCQSGQCYPGDMGTRCGRKYGVRRRCTNNYCCSKDGYCGVGPEYCEYGCEPLYGVCYYPYLGTYFDLPNAAINNMCSIYGWNRRFYASGLGPWYCGDGCKGPMCYIPTTLAPAAAANASTLLAAV